MPPSLPAAAILLVLSVSSTGAQHTGHGSHRPGQAAGPYAGHQEREVTSLSAAEVSDLRAGRGMGLALPAELQGYPGPLHVLELEGSLALSAAQREIMTRLVASMRAEVIPLGDEVMNAERALDDVFTSGIATAEEVDTAVTRAAIARGRLRSAHLRVHLTTRESLTDAQRARYAELRGYRIGR